MQYIQVQLHTTNSEHVGTENMSNALLPFKQRISNAKYFVFRAVLLDVGGRRHKVLESNFNIYPNTR